MDRQPVYRRILLKMSGEALAPASREEGVLDFAFMERIARVLLRCRRMGVEIGVTVGAGNIWRGKEGGTRMDRCRADHMGMLATVINALALEDAFVRAGMPAAVLTSVHMDAFADHYNVRRAERLLSEGKTVIFGGGMGSPYFSTDTAAALRAAEIRADAILMAKRVDYLYDDDPDRNPDAQPILDITYEEILKRNLRAFDMTAVSFCRDNGMECLSFGLSDPENIYRAVMGEPVGTRIHN